MQAMSRYRQQAYDAAAIHDLANAVKAEEAYYATNQTYVDVHGQRARRPSTIPADGRLGHGDGRA